MAFWRDAVALNLARRCPYIPDTTDSSSATIRTDVLILVVKIPGAIFTTIVVLHAEALNDRAKEGFIKIKSEPDERPRCADSLGFKV